MKCKAAILTEVNKPLVVGDIEIPKLDVGQVLVKICYSGICGAQLGEIAGAGGEDKYLPHLLGHEGGGIVQEVGAGVSTMEEGDYVVAHWRQGSGIEAGFPLYKWEGGIVGGGRVTTFSEYSVISENRLTKISKSVPLELAALMGCSVTTAWGLINNEARLRIGQSILVLGCGSVGLNVVNGARMVSANPIVAIDRQWDKAQGSRDCGASKVYTHLNGMEYKFDVVVDTTGDIELIEKGFEVVAEGGRMILVGQPHHENDLTLRNMRQHYKGKILMDSQGGLTNPTVDIPRYLNLIEDLGLEYGQPSMYPLEGVNTAIHVMQNGSNAGKVMLEMNR